MTGSRTEIGNSGAKRKFMLIDGHSLIHRAFYALPTSLTTSKGVYTNAVYGFATMLMRLLEDHKPDSVAVVFDCAAPTFRHVEFAAYKAHRPEMAEELRMQIPLIRRLVEAFRLAICEKEGYEADDVIGTLAAQAAGKGFHTLIVTGDKDALQLVSPEIEVLYTRRGISDLAHFTEAKVEAELGVKPGQVVELKALIGDKSDNIPGIAGIGVKSAVMLLQRYRNLENLLAHAQEIGGRMGEKLLAGAETAKISRHLATIVTDVPLEVDWSSFAVVEPDLSQLHQLLTELEMRSVQKQLERRYPRYSSLFSREKDSGTQGTLDFTAQGPASAPESGLASSSGSGSDPLPDPVFHRVTRESWQEKIESMTPPLTALWLHHADAETGTEVAAKAPADARAEAEAKPAARGLQEVLTVADGTQVIAANAEVEVLKAYLQLLSSGREIITHNLKAQLVAAGRQGLPLPTGDELTAIDDLMLASYCHNPSHGDHSLADIAVKEEQDPKCFSAITEAEAEQIKPSVLARCHTILNRAADRLKHNLTADGLSKLYKEVELPLSPVLARMELVGIKVDRERLSELSLEMAEEIAQLTQRIYEAAGEEFNINSPKQLSRVLFDKLGLPATSAKTTKSGRSTAADVLEELAEEHEIVKHVLAYRQLAKLKGTYVDALPALINPQTGRVHTTFNQAVTATGRLSSTNPNLQNIPVRTAEGRQIRSAFIPGDAGWCLVTADYSQIELRVLAHLSQDEHLIEAFINGLDIHAKTAAEVFQVPISEVTADMRRAAKAINFGIVYGISSFGLAKGTGLTRTQAEEYINNYFARYSGVKKYMTEIVASARRLGYTTTIMGRRRYLPEINSRRWQERSFAERTAMNSPIQGSAADIIKCAMIIVDRELRARNMATRLLLQVHDELVLESPEEELHSAAAVIKEAMENACRLAVPLVVDIGAGCNWLDVEELTNL